MKRWIAIAIGIIVLICAGSFFVTIMVGGVITGGAILDSDAVASGKVASDNTDKVIENEYFRISDFGEEVEGGI